MTVHTYLRFILALFVLVRRPIGWEEALSIPCAFALYYVGFALLARNYPGTVGVMETCGVVLVGAGSLIDAGSELLRGSWKRRRENRGRLYTAGLFRFAVHINCTGDVIWVLGLALIAANPWGFLIPVALFCFFAFFNAPLLDQHLKEKYGDAFREFASRTARLIPGIW